MPITPLIDTAILSGLTIAALHWFPWRRLLGSDLHRLLTYSLGVGVILSIPTLLYLRHQPLTGSAVVAMFWTAGIAAGVATAAAWAVDGLIEGMHRVADLEEARHERTTRRMD